MHARKKGLAAATFWAAAAVQAGLVQNPSFEFGYNETWPHYGAVDFWTGASGSNRGDGPFHNNGTPVPDGIQMGFKQGSGDISQEITGLEPGKRYVIQFAYDARACCGGAIDLLTKINDVELDKIANVQPVTDGNPYRSRSVAFTAESDFAMLTFTTVASGDATVLLDAVTVVQRDANALAVINPSFEASGEVLEAGGILTPANLFGWVAEGQYGVNISGVGPYADNGTPPDQDQVGVLVGESLIRQSVRVVAGKPYQLSFAYNAPTGNSPRLRVKVGDQVVFDEDVAPVGGSAAYRTRTVDFTSSDVAHVIEFAQTTAGDVAVLLDNIKVTGEIPPEVDPVSLIPEVAELGVGEVVDITVKAPADALAVKDVTVVVQSSSSGAFRFVDPSEILTPIARVEFARGGEQEKTVRLQGLARGSGNLQITDASGLPIKNQVGVTVVASALKNPSFDSTPAPAGVGYGEIPGWTGGPGTGMNAVGQPFADNGLIPDRKQVALVQGASFISQEARGLIPGRNYWLQFFYNIRNCCPEGESRMDLVVSVGGKIVAELPGIEAVGEGLPYHFHHVAFVAESATALLEFKTTPTGDATFLLDGVTIVQRDPGQIVVRNPSFEASGSVFPFPGYFDAVAGWEVGGGGRGANIDGVGPFTDNGRANAGDMVLFMQGAGSFVAQTLSGLTGGSDYLVAFLMNARACCGGEDSGLTVSVDDAPIFEEPFQPVGGVNPYHVRQATFTASGEEASLRFTGFNSGGDHTVLLDNVVVLPASGAAPVLLAQPAGALVPAGGSVTLGAAAAGSGTLTYQWRKDGQPLEGQTEPILMLEGLEPSNSGEYSVEVKNASGTVTSAGAVVSVQESIPGLFDSGVDADRVLLADGAVDPHYKLAINADNAASDTVYAQDSTKFPIAEGPWLANNELSRWIGPREDPSAATAGGLYAYRLNLDLTGFNPDTVVLSGNWAADNSAELWVNGVPTGATQAGFGGLGAFSVTRFFKAGVNTIDFRVTNGDLTGGPTGLRVEGLAAVGAKGGSTPAPSPTLTVSRSGAGIRLSWPTAATGFVLQSTAALPAGWADDPAPIITEGANSVVVISASGGGRYYRLIRR
ncbi:MAG: hypothetical protein AB7O66_19050 [Limisphaerales bacterium]